jgi:pimeloyl-ACP methyl ester carboxylesterase
MRIIGILAAFVALVAASPPAATDERAAGDWIGTLGPAQLHLAVHIRRTADGLAGTFDSVDQGAFGLPLASVKAEGASLSFDVPAVGGHYAGTWDAAASHYAGEWSQQTVRLPLALSRGTAAAHPVIQGLDGDWDGAIGDPVGGALRLVFHIRTGPGGTIAAGESPDQPVGAVPFAISRDGDRIVLESRLIGARFEGLLSADGTRIAGRWTQGPQQSPLTLKRRPAGAPAPAPRKRPQVPQGPLPYRAFEVGFDNPTGGNHLAGTLTVPPGPGPFPTALLITGSGQQDRDETIAGHKPFLILADYLTRRGIAVLRLDDRGAGGSTGDFAKATTLDFASDTEAALAFLRTRPEVDARRIGLIGHSEGGIVAAMVAARNPSVAWSVLMAGPGLPGDKTILLQQRRLAAAAGAPPAQLEKYIALWQRIIAAAARAPDEAAARAAIKAILLEAGWPSDRADPIAKTVGSDWYRKLLELDPQPSLRRIRAPVLALVGTLDLQVPAPENVPALKAALAGNRDATVVALPGLNHLFQTARTGAMTEYIEIEETIAPAALKAIGDWIAAHTK